MPVQPPHQRKTLNIRYSRRISSILEELSKELVQSPGLVGKKSRFHEGSRSGPILALHLEGWLA